MSSNKVAIPAEVLEGLEAARLSGETNMLEVSKVVSLTLDMGYPKTAIWISTNKRLYVQGVFMGFEATENVDEDTFQEMTDRFLDRSGGDRQCAD